MAQPQDDLWSLSAPRRLRAARALAESPLKLASIQEWLCAECPVAPWPYGNATSINPMLVTLGPSPGNSPATGDNASTASLELPPAGEPHPHVYYEDGKRYWDKVRHLARTMLIPSVGSERDAFALFGNMNLDSGRSGRANQITIDHSLAKWVLHTIRRRLRPRWLVCLGLNRILKQDETLRQVFESLFDLDIGKPNEKYPLAPISPQSKTYYFREWIVATGECP